METKNTGTIVLIIVLIVVLLGGGAGLWAYLKPKTTDDQKNTDQGAAGVNTGGRDIPPPADVNWIKAALSGGFDDPTIPTGTSTGSGGGNGTGGGTGGDGPPEPGSKANPYYFKSPEAIAKIEEQAKVLAQVKSKINEWRARHDIGYPMLEGFHPDTVNAIDHLFGQLDGADLSSDPDRRYLAYPVYSTYEPNGAAIRQQLQKVLDAGWEKLNLTDFRDASEPWVISALSMNLLVGTVGGLWTPNSMQVQLSHAPRELLDFYKGMNGHWVSDAQLADEFVNRYNPSQVVAKGHPDARASFCAGHLYTLVEKWVAEIDRLDYLVEFYALKFLIKKVGLHFTNINPETEQADTLTDGDPHKDLFADL